MIGYYVHHHGGGHRHRASAVAHHLRHPVTGLSSAPRPDGWPGAWVALPRDDATRAPHDVDAHGRLHWVPEHDDGLRSRTAAVSAWIGRHRPTLMMVDVSVEVTLLARLHGIPVVSMVLPGERGDAAHQLGHDVARRLVAAWPDSARGLVRGVHEEDPRLVRVGALSRHDHLIDSPAPARTGAPHVVVLMGSGGTDLSARDLAAARGSTPDWRWTVLDARLGTWSADPWSALRDADVVVTHAGQNALAEVAAARVPAVVVPQLRPHREQETMARALAADGRWPVIVQEAFVEGDWPALLERARRMPGQRWQTWNDGQGAQRLAALLDAEAGVRAASVPA